MFGVLPHGASVLTGAYGFPAIYFAEKTVKSACRVVGSTLMSVGCEVSQFTVLLEEIRRFESGGSESLPLRHAVWSAEKLGYVDLKIAEIAAILQMLRSNRTGESVLLSPQSTFRDFFSGGHIGSPVLTTPSGECNAITVRWDGETDLTVSP